jgi:hypothetical protein
MEPAPDSVDVPTVDPAPEPAPEPAPGPVDVPTGSTGFTGATGAPEPAPAPGPEPAPAPASGPAPIISIDDLVSAHDLLLQKEAADKLTVSVFATPETSDLTGKLYMWAKGGFAPIYPLYTVVLQVPQTCADGVSRNFYEYTRYLLGDEIGVAMAALNARLPGMTLSYSLTDTSATLHVSKTA